MRFLCALLLVSAVSAAPKWTVEEQEVTGKGYSRFSVHEVSDGTERYLILTDMRYHQTFELRGDSR